MYLRTSCGYILLLVQKSGKRIDADGFRFREIDMQGRTDSLNLCLSFNRCIARRIVFYDAFNSLFPYLPLLFRMMYLPSLSRGSTTMPLAFTTGCELS